MRGDYAGAADLYQKLTREKTLAPEDMLVTSAAPRCRPAIAGAPPRRICGSTTSSR